MISIDSQFSPDTALYCQLHFPLLLSMCFAELCLLVFPWNLSFCDDKAVSGFSLGYRYIDFKLQSTQDILFRRLTLVTLNF